MTQPEKGSLQYLMQKIPDIKPMYLAFAVRKAMGQNGKNMSEVSKTEGLSWACSHIGAVKKALEERRFERFLMEIK